jgi:hypothetical protein
MTRLLGLIVFSVAVCTAADVRFTWLPFSSNVTGVPQTQTATTQYGINVLIDSDNPKVTDFQVQIAVKKADSSVKISEGTVARQAKSASVRYSTIYSVLIDSNLTFEVLAVQVRSVIGLETTKPIPGLEYASDTQ